MVKPVRAPQATPAIVAESVARARLRAGHAPSPREPFSHRSELEDRGDG